MASLLVAIAAGAVVLVVVATLAADAFGGGDHIDEALARALREDLEAAAARSDRCPPS